MRVRLVGRWHRAPSRISSSWPCSDADRWDVRSDVTDPPGYPSGQGSLSKPGDPEDIGLPDLSLLPGRVLNPDMEAETPINFFTRARLKMLSNDGGTPGGSGPAEFYDRSPTQPCSPRGWCPLNRPRSSRRDVERYRSRASPGAVFCRDRHRFDQADSDQRCLRRHQRPCTSRRLAGYQAIRQLEDASGSIPRRGTSVYRHRTLPNPLDCEHPKLDDQHSTSVQDQLPESPLGRSWQGDGWIRRGGGSSDAATDGFGNCSGPDARQYGGAQ